MAYNDKHKQLLQYFMHERMVSEHKALMVNKFLFGDKILDNHIELINLKIAPLEFKINKTVGEEDGKINYVFIATFVDDFTKQESSKVIFRALVLYIMKSGGSVAYWEALKFNSQMNESLMRVFFNNKYLIADSNDNVFLSPLAICEMDGYLAEHFNEKRCMACKSIVSHGVKCTSCGQFGHGLCLDKYFTSIDPNKQNKKCPKCTKEIDFNWAPIEIVKKF